MLWQLDYYLTRENRLLITELPTHGARTLYSRLGDWFAYGCAVLLAALLVVSGARSRKR